MFRSEVPEVSLDSVETVEETEVVESERVEWKKYPRKSFLERKSRLSIKTSMNWNPRGRF